jgi:glycosyltransferase involved in cell wall biosynthesis
MHGENNPGRGNGGGREAFKMNILYITNHLNIGGITSYCLTLATGLKNKGHKIYIASSGGVMLPEFIKQGITYLPAPIKTKKEIGPKIAMCEFVLAPAIRRFDIDIIHSHSRTTQVLGALLSRHTGVPHIFTCHGFFKRRWLRRIFPCWGDKVIAISEQVKEHLIRDFGVDENKINVIHNGIDADKFKITDLASSSESRKKIGLGNGPVVGIVARLSDVKGHKYLIEAMKDVLKEIPDAQLLVCGDGKEKNSLVKLADQLGISKSVFFKPEAQGTSDVLSAMDVFVMPSLHEGLGLALMEAMAAGLPVIGSDIGGIKTLIEDGVTGLLVRPTDSQGLSRAIVMVLADRGRAILLARNAYYFIRENFSQEKMVDETERLYRECLKARE